MSDIEENTKALNRLTNTLLGIFGGATQPAAAAATPPATPTATVPVKTQPAPVKPAPVAAPLAPTRAEIGALVIKYGAIGGRDKAVALLASYKAANGEPAKSISKGDSTVQDTDLRDIAHKLVDLLGPTVVAETMKAASAK